jgi:hypothetical protein
MSYSDLKVTQSHHFWYNLSTCAEDRATLESDPSADTGG